MKLEDKYNNKNYDYGRLTYNYDLKKFGLVSSVDLWIKECFNEGDSLEFWDTNYNTWKPTRMTLLTDYYPDRNCWSLEYYLIDKHVELTEARIKKAAAKEED